MSTEYTPEQIARFAAEPELAPRYMRPELAERVFGVSRKTLQRRATAGLIRMSRPGGRVVLYDRDSILALIATCANRAEVAPK